MLASVMPASNKTVTISFRTRQDTRDVLETIAEDFGGNLTSTLEFIIRDYARRKGVTRKPKQSDTTPDAADK